MSMTKRYLESLPEERQNDILGLPPQDDEWDDSAENGPEVDSDGLEVEYEDEDEVDKFEQRDGSELRKPRGKCVVEVAHDGVKWDV